jgi:hypothetical protein
MSKQVDRRHALALEVCGLVSRLFAHWPRVTVYLTHLVRPHVSVTLVSKECQSGMLSTLSGLDHVSEYHAEHQIL